MTSGGRCPFTICVVPLIRGTVVGCVPGSRPCERPKPPGPPGPKPSPSPSPPPWPTVPTLPSPIPNHDPPAPPPPSPLPVPPTPPFPNASPACEPHMLPSLLWSSAPTATSAPQG